MSREYKFRSTTLSMRKISDIIELEREGKDKIHDFELPAIPVVKQRCEKRKTIEKKKINCGTRFGVLRTRRDMSTQTEHEEKEVRKTYNSFGDEKFTLAKSLVQFIQTNANEQPVGGDEVKMLDCTFTDCLFGQEEMCQRDDNQSYNLVNLNYFIDN